MSFKPIFDIVYRLVSILLDICLTPQTHGVKRRPPCRRKKSSKENNAKKNAKNKKHGRLFSAVKVSLVQVQFGVQLEAQFS